MIRTQRPWTAKVFDLGSARVAVVVKSLRAWDREATTIDRSGWQVHRFVGFVLAVKLLPAAMIPSHRAVPSTN